VGETPTYAVAEAFGVVSDVLKVIDALRLARSGTLSNLRTTLIVIALLRGIWMFNKFDSIWLEAQFRPHYKDFRLDFSLSNYGELPFATEFVRYFAHILIAAVGAIVLNVVAATLAGYGLTWFAFPSKRPSPSARSSPTSSRPCSQSLLDNARASNTSTTMGVTPAGLSSAALLSERVVPNTL
jgi:hypothetical protein